jgi:hypothetical protein
MGESVLTRERHAIVAVGADGGDISDEDRGHAGQPSAAEFPGPHVPYAPVADQRLVSHPQLDAAKEKTALSLTIFHSDCIFVIANQIADFRKLCLTLYD